MIGLPLLLAQDASVRQKFWRIISKRIVFGAPRLFHANRLLTGLYKQETQKYVKEKRTTR